MQKLEKFYDGKAKQVFSTDDPEYVIIHYTDAATACNNIKKASCAAASRLSRSRSSSATSSQGQWRSGSASRRGRGRRT